jgi:PsbN protein
MEAATVLSNMEPATAVILSVGIVTFCVTVWSVYLSFGPPSKELADPFDDHDD